MLLFLFQLKEKNRKTFDSWIERRAAGSDIIAPANGIVKRLLIAARWRRVQHNAFTDEKIIVTPFIRLAADPRAFDVSTSIQTNVPILVVQRTTRK